jgi:hypothetical protein
VNIAYSLWIIGKYTFLSNTDVAVFVGVEVLVDVGAEVLVEVEVFVGV